MLRTRLPEKYRPAIFLSYPTPYDDGQDEFVDTLRNEILKRGFTPRTLGITDYDMSAPLRSTRSVMLDTYGMVAVAFRRMAVAQGQVTVRRGNNDPTRETLTDQWFTSPWVHIETAMAYQQGLPVLILSQSGVFVEGMLEASAVGMYMPTFNLDEDANAYFRSNEFDALFTVWTHRVRTLIDRRTSGDGMNGA